ncbi:MAG: glycosyltransferase [Cyanobacteriota bacterium]|nr:glycosyltransferase [Cyanobacteriota bacterium]
MKLCWLIPSDRGGGVTSVAVSVSQQATSSQHELTLLTVIAPLENLDTNHKLKCDSLQLKRPARETPIALLEWLQTHPQNVLFLNGCEQADAVIPYLPNAVKCVYVVHDTAPQYWLTAVREEENLEAIVAVSDTVARQFRHRLKTPEKLWVILNGCVFPDRPTSLEPRPDDLIFLGGEKPIKGSFDVLELWQQLAKQKFRGKLHWFGQISTQFRAKIDRLPHRDRIHLYDRTSRQRIFETAATAKIILMLSRVEPFGMATIEAMGMGCVPVAWDIETGTREIATANESGLFAPLGDTAALADLVSLGCRNYPTLGPAAMERARSHFDSTTMWQGYESLLKKLDRLPPLTRNRVGESPQPYQPPQRQYQKIPAPIRAAIRQFVGRYPRLGYWVRDFRGL